MQVIQEGNNEKPVNEELQKVLVIGDADIGKSSLIQQMIGGHHKKVIIGPTKSAHFYERSGRFQFIDPPHDKTPDFVL